jgi:hypothetical protein
MEIEEGSCLSSGFELGEILLFHDLEESGFEGLSTGEGIGEGLIADFLSLRIHEADGIVFGTYITNDEQSLRQRFQLLSFRWMEGVKRGL